MRILNLTIALLFLICTGYVGVIAQDKASNAPEVDKERLDPRFIGTWVENTPVRPAELTFNKNGTWKFVFQAMKGRTQTNSGVWQLVEGELMLWSAETEMTINMPYEFVNQDVMLITVGNGQKKMRRTTFAPIPEEK
jgi:hypothetical protein